MKIGSSSSGTEKMTPKNLRDRDFAELLGELSGAICLKSLALLGSALDVFRKLFGAVRATFWLWGSLLALDECCGPSLYVMAADQIRNRKC